MNTLKIALGFAVAAAGAYVLNRVIRNESQKQHGTAKTHADQESEKDHREHLKPQDQFITDPISAAKHSDTFPQNYQAATKNVQFHQRGVRHR